MMKKMQTIGTIMETFDAETTKNIEEVVKRGINAMGKEGINWKNFRVYAKSVDKMRVVISKDISYLFAVIASLEEEDALVNIVVLKTLEESSVCSHNMDDNQVLSIVSIKESYFKKLSSKKK